jgi:hypothetical protein
MSARPTPRKGQRAVAPTKVQPPSKRQPDAEAFTTSTIHLPADLLNALRLAANRRSMRRMSGKLSDGKNTRPSVSEVVVELLQQHRDELDRWE